MAKNEIVFSFNLPSMAVTSSIIASPDSTHIAYVVADPMGVHVGLNGRSFYPYEYIAGGIGGQGITFSPDSQRIGYVAGRNGKRFVVCDEVEYRRYDKIGMTSPVFSPDSKRVAYTAAKQRNSWFGKKQSENWFAVVDEQIIGGPYEGFAPGGILFSPDSQKIAYVVKDGENWSVILDGKVHGKYSHTRMRTLTFSPDSTKLGYVALVGGKVNSGRIGEAIIIVDGLPPKVWPYNEKAETCVSTDIYFSPNSERVAYWVSRNGKSFLVVDGIQHKEYDGDIVSGWNYPENHPEAVKLPGYGRMSWKPGNISFSPDSKHFASAVEDSTQCVLVYDGADRMQHQKITSWPIIFSPDSKRIVYVAEKERTQFVVLDWTLQKSYYGITGDRRFSPDSRHLAYFAMEQQNKFSLAIDQETVAIQGGPVHGANIVWDDSDKLHTLVADRRSISVVCFQI